MIHPDTGQLKCPGLRLLQHKCAMIFFFPQHYNCQLNSCCMISCFVRPLPLAVATQGNQFICFNKGRACLPMANSVITLIQEM